MACRFCRVCNKFLTGSLRKLSSSAFSIMSIYTQLYKISGLLPQSRPDREPDWRLDLPADWQAMVVAPIRFEVCREYEIAADRTTGFDESDLPCYCAYRYVLTEPRLDDDELFYDEPVYAEKRTAWRLRDDRWLVFREVAASAGCDRVHAFYSFGDAMPR